MCTDLPKPTPIKKIISKLVRSIVPAWIFSNADVIQLFVQVSPQNTRHVTKNS